MRIELTDDLIELQARVTPEAAMAGRFSDRGWTRWLDASQEATVAITAHARATGQNREQVAVALIVAARKLIAQGEWGGVAGR